MNPRRSKAKKKKEKRAVIGYRDKSGKFVPFPEKEMTRIKAGDPKKEIKKKIKVVKAPPETVVFHMGGKPVTLAMLEQWAMEDTIELYRREIIDRTKIPQKYLRALVSTEEEAKAKLGRVIGKKGKVIVRKLPKDYPVLEMRGKVYTVGELEQMADKFNKWCEKKQKEKKKKGLM